MTPEGISRHKIVFLMGPTGVGKSSLAMELANHNEAGIANLDSLQVYQELNIGTAKPSEGDRMKLPHYLFDVVSAPAHYTAGQYRRDALEVIARELPRRHLFFVGGSGFYQQALEKGMYDVAAVSEELKVKWEQRAAEEGQAVLYQELAKLDPEYAQKVNSSDRYRTLRALTLMQAQGQSMTSIQREFASSVRSRFPYSYAKIGLAMDREKLKQRLQLRTQEMLSRGLIEEVESLIQRGFATWPPLQSIGYTETVEFLRQPTAKDQLVESIVQSSMRLAKRQMTWLRRDSGMVWFDVEEDLPALKAYVQRFLLN